MINPMASREEKISKLLQIAESLLGKPYKYGARPEEAPEVFDCSSFTQYLYKQIGIELPRTTIEQAMVGKKISRKSLLAGDLIFFKGEIGRYNKYFPQGIGHVALFTGGGKVVHAHRTRVTGKYVNIYHPEKIREYGKIMEENLSKVIKREKPLVVIKRYV